MTNTLIAELDDCRTRIDTEIARLQVEAAKRPKRAPRPGSVEQAVARWRVWVDKGVYVLGTGDYSAPNASPFTKNKLGTGCDCYGFITWGIQVPRHRPGFAHGPGSYVEDDANCDSAIYDAEHERDLWEPVCDLPRPGDIVVWPSTYDVHGHRDRIGHVGAIERVDRIDAKEWDPNTPAWDALDIIQCCAKSPAIIRSDARWWAGREHYKGAFDAGWRSRILRVVP